ncbi:MAG TPA: rRNA maturation RNase YbeY [Acidimicrobiales bacterium]|nr:rRNA maturation RNase YbeY [Acidimicrobiales bacterium]
MVAVLVTDEQDDQPVDTRRWVNLARSVLEAEDVTDAAELSMAFVDEESMAELNQRFAGEEGPTDVLAFPIDDTDPGDGTPAMLGDLVICPAVAARNSAHHAGTYEDEVALLVVHGILHLMGMDHEDALEAQLMQRRERELLARFQAASAGAQP